jgi:hypothetical protein
MKPLVSTLDKIATQVFEAKTLDIAKKICIDYLQDSKIKESDRIKMISEIENIKYLPKIQMYIANALLKYEGLGVGNKPTKESIEKPNTES